MKTNYANTYLLQNKISVYANIESFQQVIYYWDIQQNREISPPIWRTTRELVNDAKILDYTNQGCRVELFGNVYEFKWTKTNNNGNPFQVGNLILSSPNPEFEDSTNSLSMPYEQVTEHVDNAIAWYYETHKY